MEPSDDIMSFEELVRACAKRSGEPVSRVEKVLDAFLVGLASGSKKHAGIELGSLGTLRFSSQGNGRVAKLRFNPTVPSR